MSMHAQFEKFFDDVSGIQVARVVPIDKWQPDASESILVGRGSYNPAGSAPSPVLVLNNKSTEPRFDRKYSSLAHLMAAPPAGLLDDWTLSAERPLAPAEALARLTLVVEDASPDSVMGVLLVLMHLQGLAPDAFPADWIEAVDQWERDGTVEDPRTAWTALASALAHRHFATGKASSNRDNTAAWIETLHFLAQCLRRDLHPYAIPSLPNLGPWRSAQAALRQEEQTYLGWLPHASQVQLLLPAKGSNERWLLVDGLLFTEDQPTGTAKVFYRNDLKHALLGQGFTLAAHYRPSEARTGNDFTIAVDPRREVYLTELWHELERQEDKAWACRGLARPSDRPRELATVANARNQPWYLKDEEDLIAAPREVEVTKPDGTKEMMPGTLLTWGDVQEAIWTVFNPLNGVAVHVVNESGEPPAEQTVPLLDLRPAGGAHSHAKRLILAKWPSGAEHDRSGRSPRALNDSPIVERVIAGLIGRGNQDRLTLAALPPIGTWQRIELDGGFAILTHDGLFILDDWRDRELRALPEICKAFDLAAELDRDLGKLEVDSVEGLAKKMGDAVLAGRMWESHIAIMQHAAAAGVRLADLRGREAGIPQEPDARRLREALDRQWGLDRRLTGLEQQIKSISDAAKTLGEARLLSVTRVIGIFAFGPYMASSLATPLSKLFVQTFQHKLPGDDAPAWLWWACFGGIFALITLSLLLWFKLQGSSAARKERRGKGTVGE